MPSQLCVSFISFLHLIHSFNRLTLGLIFILDVKAERLPARAGLIQAAINLELSGMSFGGIDVLIEGINGLLPNLDLVNLVHKLARENGIRSTIHHRVGPTTSLVSYYY